MNEAIIETRLGALRLVATDDALTRVDLPNRVGTGATAIEVGDIAHPILRNAAAQLVEYFDGEREDFDLPLAMTGTEFQREAWEALREIPYGTTRSYAEQAKAIGRPTATRAIGAANGKNPIPIIVPCHRVIGADGSLTGYGGGEAAKRWLLNHEARQRSLFVTSP